MELSEGKVAHSPSCYPALHSKHQPAAKFSIALRKQRTGFTTRSCKTGKKNIVFHMCPYV